MNMKISIVTLFPKMIEGFLNESIVKRAQEKGVVEIEIINLRDFAIDSYGTVDDRPYGGGAGMILRVEPIYKVLSKIFNSPFILQGKQFSIFNKKSNSKNQKVKTILTSAKGKQFNQTKAKELSKLDNIIIIAGHYEGVDERILDYVDEEISLGDFVMTGGEIAAVAIVDSIVRLLPGVLKKENATEEESFFEVSIDELNSTVGKNNILENLVLKGRTSIKLLEYPHYTRPEEFEGKKVPEILKCGDPKKIRQWRLKQALVQTLTKRPDLLI